MTETAKTPAQQSPAQSPDKLPAPVPPIEVGPELRWSDKGSKSLPPIPFPSWNIYRGAGEAKIRALARRLHERLRDSEAGAMFPRNPRLFDAVVRRIEDYFVESTGGPPVYTTHLGRPDMGRFHARAPVDARARDVWLGCLWAAFDDVDFPAEHRAEFWDWVEPFSLRVMNRHDPIRRLARYPYAETLATGFTPCG